ncbi:MAG TPA: gliding motility-associated C-terminal domain-containing protein, partial [Cyclobacteriaceae bacterium]
CGTSFTTTPLPQIDNISAIVTDPGVDLNWLVDPKINKPDYSLFRSIGGSIYLPFAKAADKKFTDADYTTAGAYCYRVDYIDACGNFSPAGIPTCPIRLAGTLLDNNIVTLSWSKFNGWKDGVKNYVVDRYSTTGSLINSINMDLDTTYSEDPDPKIQSIRYRIRAISTTTGLTASLSNIVEIAKKTNIYTPTAFTPNQDKLNDTFTVSGYYISKISLMIFDRWGALVYTSDKSEAWNGTKSETGQLMPEGSYIWKANVTDLSGKNFSEEGTVFLIRKGN